MSLFDRVYASFAKDMALDLGTSNTRVFSEDRGIVIHEPSVVALNRRTEHILSVGSEARDMIGKTPPHIEIVRPIQKGVISDFEVTEKMLRYFIERVHRESLAFMARPRVIVGVPLETTEVERKAMEDAVISAGARKVFLVETPMLSAIGARLPVSESLGMMVVDIGGGRTQIAVLSLSGVVTSRSIPVAGEEMNRVIVQYARDQFGLLLGERNAELAKMRIGSAIPPSSPLSIALRGRDLVSGLPREMTILDHHIREALHRSLQTIVEQVKATLEVTPPELVADIYERGIVLTGGGSLLLGMDTLLSRFAEIPVRVAEDPLTCVVRGAGLLLSQPELLRDVALPSTTEGLR